MQEVNVFMEYFFNFALPPGVFVLNRKGIHQKTSTISFFFADELCGFCRNNKVGVAF